ncbi:MAG: sn-glycerol-3-phosphate ABC transporter ATP-binding protein UgpC [Geminicoccaceae bacterium]|nr:sn-glycerol-3-phosphate ABC transporter ATP-binding protein UgpC [Geminicoccaceae bacterium]MCB9943991.1 sn-glycerol-3-phosphate ABC transporter ATP-binding protein UgpC [Geminicoccaceae bacterium]
MAAIKLENVKKSFGNVHVIKGVDLDIKSNEFIVFVGPSGCGKSTLLRLVAGLEDITSGELSIDGKVVNRLAPSDRGIAMVFQSYALYPHMTVYENMAFGLKLAKTDPGEADGKVRNAARILQLEHLLERLPKQLSGGQRQRVAIGRAITRDPKVFLFDEPLSNLDAALRVQMRIEIAKLHHSLNATMIYVTHDQVEAMTLADRIVVLEAGYVQQFGSPLDLYHHPQNRFVAGFIGSPKMNFLPAELVATESDRAQIRTHGGATLSAPIRAHGSVKGNGYELGIRPEHLVEGGGGDAQISGPVVAVEHLGAETYLYVDMGQELPLTVKSAGNSTTRPGDTIQIGIPSGACYLFDKDGKAFDRQAYDG